jgi:hypothetical protein
MFARIRPVHRLIRNLAVFASLVITIPAFPLNALAGAAPDEPAAENVVEGRLLLAIPAALPTGLTWGFNADYTRGSGWLAYGAGASYSTATEYTLTEIVRNDEIRLRAFGVLQHAIGRGTAALRLGAGGTIVYEDRARSQGTRAGLTGSALQTTAWATLPAADLEFNLRLRIIDAFSLTMGGGPSMHLVHGGIRSGWLAGLGVAWEH